MAVLYVSRGNTIMFYRCTLLFFQTRISEITERIPFILSRNIRSRCNLIMHRQKLVDLYSPQKNYDQPPPPKWAFRSPSSTLDGE